MRDTSHAIDVDRRPRQLLATTDYMLADWSGHDHLDASRIGVFGFSSGGFTALVSAGGSPDFTTEPAHVAAHRDWFDSQLVIHASPEQRARSLAVRTWVHDSKIKAAVIAAPALGYTFGKTGLAGVTVPVQLWRAQNDHILPHPDYAQAVNDNLPTSPGYHVVPGADHFDFLAPCDDQLRHIAPQICVSSPGFDRIAFHVDFDRAVVAFFTANLATGSK